MFDGGVFAIQQRPKLLARRRKRELAATLSLVRGPRSPQRVLRAVRAASRWDREGPHRVPRRIRSAALERERSQSHFGYEAARREPRARARRTSVRRRAARVARVALRRNVSSTHRPIALIINEA